MQDTKAELTVAGINEVMRKYDSEGLMMRRSGDSIIIEGNMESRNGKPLSLRIREKNVEAAYFRIENGKEDGFLLRIRFLGFLRLRIAYSIRGILVVMGTDRIIRRYSRSGRSA